MNRRPKLSLVSNRKLNKPQALGMEAERQDDKPQERKAGGAVDPNDQDRHTAGPVIPEQLHASNRGNSRTGWPKPRQLATIVIALGTFALSLYLIKRRLL